MEIIRKYIKYHNLKIINCNCIVIVKHYRNNTNSLCELQLFSNEIILQNTFKSHINKFKIFNKTKRKMKNTIYIKHIINRNYEAYSNSFIHKILFTISDTLSSSILSIKQTRNSFFYKMSHSMLCMYNVYSPMLYYEKW